MTRVWAGLLACILAAPSYAATVTNPGGDGGSSGIPRGTTLPSSPAVGDLFVVLDDSAVGACDSAAGTSVTVCVYNGTDWVSAGLPEVQGLGDVITLNRTYGGAVSQATAPRFGSAVTGRYWLPFDDPTDGLTFDCEVNGVLGACDKGPRIQATYKSYIAASNGDRMQNFEPNASTPKARWALGTLKIRKYIYFPAGYFVGDGTNCPLQGSQVTINSGPKVITMVCGSAANGDMDFDVVMPQDWDGGTLEFEPVYTQTAANTAAMHSDIKAQCRGAGETPSGTWGASVAIDDASVTGSSATDKTLSAAVTPAGTCAAGDQLFVRYTLDVTGTTTPEATLHFYGIGMYYMVDSMSN